jgi:hypothetical protein
VPKPVVPPKKPAPAKPGAKPGKKGLAPAGGKSAKPDPKAQSDQAATKSLESGLVGLKNNEPYSKPELDKALGALKAKAKGISFNARPDGEKWIVTASSGGKKKSAGQIALAMKGVKAAEKFTKGTVSAVLDWWKEKLGFTNKAGESHTLQFIGTGDSAQIGIASSLTPARDYLDKHPDKGSAEWNTANSVFTTELQVIFSPAAKNKAEKERRAEIKRELAKVSAAFAKLGGGAPDASDYGSNSDPTYRNPAKVDVIFGEPKAGTRTGPWPTAVPGYKEIYDAGLTTATDPWVQMHIISEKLGGSGTDLDNVVPAPQSVNLGPFRSFEHATVALVRAKSGGIKNRVWFEVTVSGTKSAARGLTGKAGLWFWKGKKASPKWLKSEAPSFTVNVGIPVPQLSGPRKLVLNFTSATEMQRDFGISSTTARLVKEGRPYKSILDFERSMTNRGATSAQIQAVLGKGAVLNGP